MQQLAIQLKKQRIEAIHHLLSGPLPVSLHYIIRSKNNLHDFQNALS